MLCAKRKVLKIKTISQILTRETDTQKKLRNFAKLQFFNDNIYSYTKKAIWRMAFWSNFIIQKHASVVFKISIDFQKSEPDFVSHLSWEHFAVRF